MGRSCSICKHPEAAHIAQALAEDASVRKLAARFGLTKSAINRHINKCLTPAVQNVIRESGKLMKDAKTAAPVLEQMRALNRRTLAILQAAERSGDGQMALSAICPSEKKSGVVCSIEWRVVAQHGE